MFHAHCRSHSFKFEFDWIFHIKWIIIQLDENHKTYEMEYNQEKRQKPGNERRGKWSRSRISFYIIKSFELLHCFSLSQRACKTVLFGWNLIKFGHAKI